MLDQHGIADRFLSEGNVGQVEIGLALWQKHIERILAGWIAERGVPIYRGREVTCFAQDDSGVDVQLSNGQSLRRSISSGVTDDAA